MKASRLLLFALLATLPLASCRIVGNRPDFSGVADALTPAQDDSVVIEGKPAASTPVAATAAATAGSYVVRSGDTLSGIARRNGVSLSSLLAANGLSGSNPIIRPGQVLRLPAAVAAAPAAPAATPQAASAGRYTMRPGDTLSAVARQHGVSLQALLQANELTAASARFVQPGAVITIPTSR